jgi:hypothetical protein
MTIVIQNLGAEIKPHRTRDGFAWLDQVLADRAIPEPAFRVAYAL